MSTGLGSCISPTDMSPSSIQRHLSPVANSITSQNSSGLLLLIFAGQAKSSWVPLNWSIAKASWQPLLEGCQEGRLLRFPPSLGRLFHSFSSLRSLLSPDLPGWFLASDREPCFRNGVDNWVFFLYACNALDLFGSWETRVLCIFSATDVVYTWNIDKKGAGLASSDHSLQFFLAVSYIFGQFVWPLPFQFLQLRQC